MLMKALAEGVGTTGNLRAKRNKEGMKTVMAPVLTTQGIRLACYVPADAARKPSEWCDEAKANTEEGA
jgi:hypothetical protein